MQHDKNNKKIEQIEKISKNPDDIVNNISDVLDKFKITSKLKNFDVIKRSGTLISNITTSLLLLPFLGVASVAAFFKTGLNNIDSGAKNAYYDVKNNPKINWRSLLMLIALQFKSLLEKDNNLIEDIEKHKTRIKAIIFDDSTEEKTGKHIEGIGFVYDHVKNIYVLGFKILVCGYFDGVSFIPIDFYLLHENRSQKKEKLTERIEKKKIKLKTQQQQITIIKEKQKKNKSEINKATQLYKKKSNKTNKSNLERKRHVKNRIDKQLKSKITEITQLKDKIFELETELFELKSTHCGLPQKEYNEQFKKKRERNTYGYRRKQELGKNKIDAAIKMIKRAVKKGFDFDYILTDSWFFCKKFLTAVLSAGKGIHLVSMAKIGKAKYEILPEKKLLNPNQIITRYERKKGRINKKYKAKYIPFQANYQGIRVKIFIIQFGKHSKWRMIVTTDTKMSFNRIMEVYQVRWTIEVFFKECKQYLQLGKSQSRDFDAQIADTTMTFIRYVFLSYYERIHYGMTIGEIFRELSQASIKENLLSDISFYFLELLKIFANNAGIDFITFYEELIRDEKAGEIIEKFNIDTEKLVA